MRSTHTFLLVLALALTHTETKPDVVRSVNIIRSFTQDLQASPSGYSYHRRSDSVHPGSYNADINHGIAKISDQSGGEKIEDMKMHGQSGTYRVAGGYGFVISHDYGSQRSLNEDPHSDVHFGASNAEPESIAVLQLDRDDSGGSIIDGSETSESVLPVKSEELDSYIGEKIYGSYMECDKLVEDGKKGPSVNPEEYYGSDVHDEREKYQSDDGYGESNNDGDKGSYVKSEKHDGSEDYKEHEYHDRAGGHDDVELAEYVHPDGYGIHGELDTRKRLYRGYDESENDNYESYEPSKMSDELFYFNGNYGPSNIGEFKKSFLKDFFKEFNQFSDGVNIQAGYNNDHGFDDGHDYNDHYVYDEEYHGDDGFEDGFSFADEDGGSEKGFFDDAESSGFHREKSDGEKNSIFGEKKGHKKGSKTTGYRNVLHKDEYTKDHRFYDHANNNGQYTKGGNFGDHHSEHEGDYENGNHRHFHSNEDHHGKKNTEDKRYFDNDDIGHRDEYGDNTYYDDNLKYSDKGGGYHDYEYAYGHPHSESDH